MNFRANLMATTLLAGFAILSLDQAAHAKGNGPNISISPNISSMRAPSMPAMRAPSISSMRVEMGRLGGVSARMLAPEDRRLIPLDVKERKLALPNKPLPRKGGKNIAKKKDTEKRSQQAAASASSNAAVPSSGQDQPGVQNGPNLPINPALGEILTVTGGNLEDVWQFAELDDWVKNGPNVVANPLFPQQDGGFAWPFGGPPSQGKTNTDGFLEGWVGANGAPGGPDTSKTGWAGIWVLQARREGRGYRESTYYDAATDRTATVQSYWRGGERERHVIVAGTDSNGNPTTDEVHHITSTGSDGSETNTRVEKHTYVQNGELVTEFSMTVTDKDGNITESDTNISSEPYEGGESEKDSQPVEEGTGRPSNRTGWCSPTGGCNIAAAGTGGPRIIPPEESGEPVGSTRRSNPLTWATDPANPDGLGNTTGGNGGRTGYTPQDEGDGGMGGPGNPEH